MLFRYLAFGSLRKCTGVKHAVLPDGQPPTVAFIALAQLCGPKANETEMGDALFTRNGEGRNFDFDVFCIFVCKRMAHFIQGMCIFRLYLPIFSK